MASKPHASPISKSHSSTSVFSGFVALLRPVNAAMASVGAFIGYALATGGLHFSRELFLAMLAVFFISGGGQAINDYFDIAIDKKRKATRPMASGLISPQMGLIYSLALFALGTLLASFINHDAFLMAGFFSLLLIAYSVMMSKIKFAGNVIVSVSVAFTYLFGATAAAITPLVLFVAIPAFFGNWAREVVKDVEDKKEDKGYKITLPQVLNTHQVNFVVLTLLVIAVFTGYLPVIFAHASAWYAGFITISNVIFILAARELVKGDAQQSASRMKKAMLVALIAQLSLLIG